jgi:uncharacterized membrane protein
MRSIGRPELIVIIIAVAMLIAFVYILAAIISRVKSSATPTIDRTDRLLKLKQLLDSGAITQNEFNTEKSRVLNS